MSKKEDTIRTMIIEVRETTEERGGGSMAIVEGTAQGPWAMWGPLQAITWPGPLP